MPTTPSNIDWLRLTESPGKGIGLFARYNTRAGMLILSEKPLFEIPRQIGTIRYSDIEGAIGTLSPPDRLLFENLHENAHAGGTKHLRIWTANAMAFGEHTAIFTQTSRFNHSCVPNVAYERNGKKDILELHTLRDIAAGEELTICYGKRAGFWLAEDRNAHHRTQYSFTCSCPACINPGRELSDMRCQLVGGILAALRDVLVQLRIDPDVHFPSTKPKRLPPRASREKQPMYWLILVKLLEAEGVRDVYLADLYRLAGERFETEFGRVAPVTVLNLEYMLDL